MWPVRSFTNINRPSHSPSQNPPIVSYCTWRQTPWPALSTYPDLTYVSEVNFQFIFILLTVLQLYSLSFSSLNMSNHAPSTSGPLHVLPIPYPVHRSSLLTPSCHPGISPNITSQTSSPAATHYYSWNYLIAYAYYLSTYYYNSSMKEDTFFCLIHHYIWSSWNKVDHGNTTKFIEGKWMDAWMKQKGTLESYCKKLIR